MDFEEHAGKDILRSHGLPVPESDPCTTVEEAETAAERLGRAWSKLKSQLVSVAKPVA